MPKLIYRYCPLIVNEVFVRYFYTLSIGVIFWAHSIFAFDKVVLWGHKLDSHTHSYIHYAFFRAFQHLEYPTFWFNDSDDVSLFDFSNALFITEGQVDENIPIRPDCFYVLHNCTKNQYADLPNKIALQVYLTTVRDNPDAEEVEPYIFYDVKNRGLYMPWGTDLLPFEIDQIKGQISSLKRQPVFHWIGTIGEGLFGNKAQLDPFIKACKENQIGFLPNDPWAHPISAQEHIKRAQLSFVFPAIVGQWQKEHGYIPCRIFKAISYGNFGVTNSSEVYNLFQRKIVYNDDTYQLFYDYKKFLSTATLELLFEQMDFVRDYHTYINRAHHLLSFINLIQDKHSLSKE